MTDQATDATIDWAEALPDIAGTHRLLIALDFDGTLAPLRDDPMTSRAIPEAVAAIERLVALPETIVALVSGRTIEHLRIIAEHGDESRVWLSGSHGVEIWRPAGQEAPQGDDALGDEEELALSERLRAEAKRIVEPVDGAWIEDKAVGFTVHTRLTARDRADGVHAAIEELIEREAPTWRARTGIDMSEYTWRHEGKDAGVAKLRAETGATAVLFAGDDVTDEDALARLEPQDLGVRVGQGATHARVRVADADEFAALLDRLADLRASAR
ncbi:MAG: trehalose-phosphatase [Microbacterium sp.]